MLAKCYSAAVSGVEARTVEIEVFSTLGNSQFAIVGLPDQAGHLLAGEKGLPGAVPGLIGAVAGLHNHLFGEQTRCFEFVHGPNQTVKGLLVGTDCDKDHKRTSQKMLPRLMALG